MFLLLLVLCQSGLRYPLSLSFSLSLSLSLEGKNRKRGIFFLFPLQSILFSGSLAYFASAISYRILAMEKHDSWYFIWNNMFVLFIAKWKCVCVWGGGAGWLKNNWGRVLEDSPCLI